eukprot:2669758-Pyramimonas_sp.AAC.1
MAQGSPKGGTRGLQYGFTKARPTLKTAVQGPQRASQEAPERRSGKAAHRNKGALTLSAGASKEPRGSPSWERIPTFPSGEGCASSGGTQQGGSRRKGARVGQR